MTAEIRQRIALTDFRVLGVRADRPGQARTQRRSGRNQTQARTQRGQARTQAAPRTQPGPARTQRGRARTQAAPRTQPEAARGRKQRRGRNQARRGRKSDADVTHSDPGVPGAEPPGRGGSRGPCPLGQYDGPRRSSPKASKQRGPARGGGGNRTRVLQYITRASPGAACCVFLSPGSHAGKLPTGSVAVRCPAKPRDRARRWILLADARHRAGGAPGLTASYLRFLGREGEASAL